MMNGFLFVSTLLAALGCGLAGGVFFAFSSFVMPALGRLPDAEGIAAMRSINVLAVTPAFMAALFGTAAVCLGLGAWAVVFWGGRFAALVLAGCALYLVGAIGVTIARNVPLNDALANADPRAPEAADLWRRYLSGWTAWNHARASSSLAASALLAAALHAP